MAPARPSTRSCKPENARLRKGREGGRVAHARGARCRQEPVSAAQAQARGSHVRASSALLFLTFADLVCRANPGSGSDSDSDFDLEQGARMAAPAPGPRGLPVFLRVHQKQVASSAAHDGQDSTPSRFGPPIKRRRVGSCAGEANITAGNASIGSMLGSDVGSH